ncbi:DUF4382 domain-containing protein [Natronomonas sp. CBA1123]|uniref:DUF4382 domain-containing protein n=1 Tax=Natronomonas sp. CBA1123 TaxID=2668070 RepID=UPI0012EA2162|nr:DUF4382 domain-containing protein [Natronomonas sp. CBA1123]MUV87378.1 DUF4382 domain-containing protein [Natronomonas sp. CBA1123]
MQRREYLIATGSVAAGASLAGCIGGATGTLATQVTDQPGDISDFESCVVTITELRIKPASDDGGDSENETDGDGDEESAEETYEVDDAEADLVELQDGNTQLVDEQEIDAGDYEYLKIQVSNVDATLDDGSDADVSTPGNAPLKFNQSFEIREDTRTVFTADFTPVKQGQSGGYVLQPVADGTEVSYEE